MTAPESTAGLGEWGAMTSRVWGLMQTAPRELCSVQNAVLLRAQQGTWTPVSAPLPQARGVGVHSQPALWPSQGVPLCRGLQEPGACMLP